MAHQNQGKQLPKKLVVLMAALTSLFLASTQTAQALPSTTSWTDAGIHEMVRFTGPLTTSISGTGFWSQAGSITVDKPAGGTVLAAYLTSSLSSNAPSDAPTNLKLNGQVVTYSHSASNSRGFASLFADVTSLIKTDIDRANSGLVSLALDEGTKTNTVDGDELVVIFDDPAKTNSPASVVIMFGSARQTGDAFTINFPALTDLTTQSARLSLGIGFSQQLSNDRSQHSDIKISTSSQTTPQTISQTAGGFDDGLNRNGSLITVGGIGDSLDLPALTALANDDELYGLNSFLTNGDTSISIQTLNTSLDDNVFQAVLVLEGVVIDGAVPLVATQQNSTGSPGTSGSNTGVSLANTGSNNNALYANAGALALIIMALGGVMVAARRFAKK